MITERLYESYSLIVEYLMDSIDPHEIEEISYLSEKMEEYEEKYSPLPEPTVEDELIHLIEQRGLNVDKAIETLKNHKTT